jgi:hypothetical protein
MGTLAPSVFSWSSFVSPVVRSLVTAKIRKESAEELHWARQYRWQKRVFHSKYNPRERSYLGKLEARFKESMTDARQDLLNYKLSSRHRKSQLRIDTFNPESSSTSAKPTNREL